MKQTKWQRLATIGLCSSLVINAFSGVTAVAETITIESSPTVASSVKEETTKASTETSEATTETSRKVMKEQETEESVKQEVVKEKEEPKEKVEQDIVAPSINKISPRATVIFPESIFQIGFVDEKGALVAPENVSIKYDYINWEQNVYSNRFTSSIITPNVEVPNVNGLKQIVLPAANIAQTNYPGPNGAGTQNAYRGTAPANFSISIPKYYENLSLYDQSGNISPAYPLPIVKQRNKSGTFALDLNTMKFYLNVKKKDDGTYTNTIENNFKTTTLRWPIIMERRVDSVAMGTHYSYYSEGPVYYHLTNRKVTESFKDTAGATIPAPTGFTQGKQTSITSNNYTFKQAGTLPETYKASNGKTYKFKGWYKGKTKPNTLTTTKAPSYPVAYNDDDDLTVVYEEIEFFDFPALTYQFGFVDESGKRVDASTIDLTYDNWHGELLSSVDGWKTTNIEKGQVALTKNNLKEIVYPSHSLEIMNGRSSQYSAANLTFKIPKYYENISVYNKNGTFDTAYPFPTIKVNTSTTPLSNRPQLFQLKKSNNQSFIFNQTTTAAPADVQVPYNLREIVYDPAASVDKGLYHMLDKPIYYYLTNRKVTENFVDANGTKITPPTGFTQGNQIPMTSNTFKYTSARALPASYSVGGKTYIFQGWYKGKTKPNTLTTSTTPTYNTTFDGNDDMTAMYKEEVPKASVALTRTTAETVTSGGNVTWRATITNTSQAPLTTATIKKSTAWTTGLAAPTAMIVT
ncbi:WxL domain-containing protein, partial [Enterococcus faecalis]|nr:WxL domain-containing protein [Enterococcus faecalis]